MKRDILEFAREYIQSDCDWTGTVEKIGYNPYIVWKDIDWEQWNDIMNNYEDIE